MKTSNFKDYLASIAEYPLLTGEQEIALAYKYREGDMDARMALINSNLRLVVFVAKQYKCNGIPFEDLVMEGNLGLITAVEKFDPDMGNRFSTCATPWIKQAIMKAITEKGKTIRLPANIYTQLNQMKKARAELAANGNDDPTDAEVATIMGVDESRIGDLKTWQMDTVSLSTPLGDDTEDTLEDLQSDSSDENPADYASRKMNEEFIVKMIADLPERTQIIFKMRYGLGSETDPADWRNEHTLEEIGQYLGLTRERIRQIEKQTLQELKVKYEKLGYSVN